MNRQAIFSLSMGVIGLLLLTVVAVTPVEPLDWSQYREKVQQFNEANSYFTQEGYMQSLGGGLYSYSTQIGQKNVWNGSYYVPYIYNELDNTVIYANSQLEFYDWYVVLKNASHTLINDMRWIVQYWQTQAGGRWAELDLYNHYFYAPVLRKFSMDIIQGYDDGNNFLNITYTICNTDHVKMTLDFLAGEENLVRFNWQLTGLSGEFLYDNNTRRFQFPSVSISLNDTQIEDNMTYEWAVATKKLDCYIENYSVGLGSTIHIDPSTSYTTAEDGDDTYWEIWDTTVPRDDNVTGWHDNNYQLYYTECRNGSNPTAENYYAFFRYQIAVPQNATIIAANISFEELYDGAVNYLSICRVNETDVGDYGLDTYPPYDNRTGGYFDNTTNGAVDALITYNITDMFQVHVNIPEWTNTSYFGIRVEVDPDTSGGWLYRLYQWDDATHQASYMNVTYLDPEETSSSVSVPVGTDVPINRINYPFRPIPYVTEFIQMHLSGLIVLFAFVLVLTIAFLFMRKVLV